MNIQLISLTEPEKWVTAIKVLRTVTGLGLKDAKDAIDRVKAGEVVEIRTFDHLSWDEAQATLESGHLRVAMVNDPQYRLKHWLASLPQDMSVGHLSSVLNSLGSFEL